MIHCWIKFRPHRWIYFRHLAERYRVCQRCAKLEKRFLYIEEIDKRWGIRPNLEMKRKIAQLIRLHDDADVELREAIRYRGRIEAT